MNQIEEVFQVRVKSITYEAEGVLSFELRPEAPSRELPAFTAGSHVDLHLTNGLIRSYSLFNPQGESDCYRVAVNLDANSRGGSHFMHNSVDAGDILTIGGPRNNFFLYEKAENTVLIAGGIGITPLFAMVRRLEELGRKWTLYYTSRSRKNAAFINEIAAISADSQHGSVVFHFDQENSGGFLNFSDIVAAAPSGTHFYCCGPLPMLEAFESATAELPDDCVHVEYFAAKEAADTSGGFTVELAKAGVSYYVPAGKTILDVLIEEGHQPLYSCQEGICGTCEVSVLEGEPDHRDLVLSAKQQKESTSMMICCSGCKGGRLVLDL
ncbi:MULTISPECIES: PDR/VanB family oxidoreductase [Halomonadaceae]|uniref:Oxidoreductase n=2 Tax=Vreelandella TaxID=3137766 RepID=A0A7Z0RWP8_9GAMM|nr:MULTISPECIES: PDR/VanB family oxidoreductase [Halomonas]NYS76469.1 oxidoreductase [Halomonas glaciei]